MTSPVLLTGFEPFGGEQINPALEVVQRLRGTTIGAEAVPIATAILPTAFNHSREVLKEALLRHRPQLVIAVGQAGGRYGITPERVAINISDARIPDNEGQQPIDEPIEPAGPPAYFSTLPVKAIVRELRTHRIPAYLSNSAGTYVCNHIFYSLMHELALSPSVRGGFIHVPFLPSQVTSVQAPSLNLDDLVRGLSIAVEVCLTVEKDLLVPEGAES